MQTQNKKIVIIVFVVLAILSCIGLVYGLIDTDKNENIENNNQEETEKLYSIGDTQICEDFEITLTGYEVLLKIYDMNGKYAKGNYLVVYYDIKNISLETQNLGKSNFKAINGNDSEYGVEGIFQKTIRGYEYNNYIEIPSDITLSVKIYFDIKETDELKFVFYQSGFLNDKIYTFYNK